MKLKNTNKSKLIVYFVTLFVVSLVFCVGCNIVFNFAGGKTFDVLSLFVSRRNKSEQQILRSVVNEKNSQLDLLWSKSDVRAVQSNDLNFVATGGSLFYIASGAEVVAVDGQDGTTVLWRITGGSPNVLYVTPSALYVGEVSSIASYDLSTGEEIWSRFFPLQRATDSLQVYDDLVYVRFVNGERFLLQANDGKMILNWGAQPGFDSAYFHDRILTPDIEYQLDLGQVVAIDRHTDTLLWYEGGALSNFVVTSSHIYAIIAEDDELKLMDFNPSTGEVETTIKFEPYTSQYYTSRLYLADFPHRVAVDEQAGLVYVFLGDSSQLFAFKMTDAIVN